VHRLFSQLHITLTVSPSGNVIKAEARGDESTLALWPQIQDEVNRWKFTPFEQSSKPVTAEVEEYVDLVRPERLPTRHVTAPPITPTSKIAISLERSSCFGSCPAYIVSVVNDGIVFEGRAFVVATGRWQTDRVDLEGLRKLARQFVAADFYSMDLSYKAGVTDSPTYILSISIDGQKKVVEDYVGVWVGIPAVITELEDDVDAFARTERWIGGGKEVLSPSISPH
jgi:hypothetical protein